MSWLEDESILGRGYKLTKLEGVRLKVKQTKGIRIVINNRKGTLNMKKKVKKSERRIFSSFNAVFIDSYGYP